VILHLKRRLAWYGVLALEIVIILFAIRELKAGATAETKAVEFLKSGLFLNSFALPISGMGAYGLLWLEEFSTRRMGVYLSCGKRRSEIYTKKSLLGAVWVLLSFLLMVSGLWLGGNYNGKGVISNSDFRSLLPTFVLYFGIVLLLGAASAFLGMLFRKNTAGMAMFGFLLFFWNRWRKPLGEERIYEIIFEGNWKEAWLLFGIFTVLTVVFYTGGAILSKRVDFR